MSRWRQVLGWLALSFILLLILGAIVEPRKPDEQAGPTSETEPIPVVSAPAVVITTTITIAATTIGPGTTSGTEPATTPVASTPPTTELKPGADDVAACNDGTFSDNTDFDGTCSAHDGVRAWLASYGECVDGTIIALTEEASCEDNDGFAKLRPNYVPPPTVPTGEPLTISTPVTDAPVTPPQPLANGLLALDVLQFVPIASEHGDGYDRDRFHAWIDADGDECDTRAEVLIDESLTFAQVDPSGCGVVAGDWYSPYDGETFSSPGDVEIDHVVALKEAWDSGAWQWTEEQQTALGNDLTDPRTLRAVSWTSNGAKGDRDPSNWLPIEPDVCRYIGDWVAIKVRWSLAMDQSEWGRINNLLEGPCAGWRIAAWEPAAVVVPNAVPLPVAPLPPPVATAPPPANCNPNYDPCVPNDSDVDCAGGKGNGPSYVRGPVRVIGVDVYDLDGDGDGYGCD